MRSGGVPSLIRIFASLRCAARGANPYATDRFGLPRVQPENIVRNNRPILRWDQRSFLWFMLDRQEESGKVAHLAGRKPIFTTNYTNVIQIIVLDYIRLIARQNWITFGPNECGGKEDSYTIKKPSWYARGNLSGLKLLKVYFKYTYNHLMYTYNHLKPCKCFK